MDDNVLGSVNWCTVLDGVAAPRGLDRIPANMQIGQRLYFIGSRNDENGHSMVYCAITVGTVYMD